jgi:hypothetical protein
MAVIPGGVRPGVWSTGKAADFDPIIRRFDPSRPSQPVWLLHRFPSKYEKGPQTAGFRAFDSRLRTSNSTFWAAELPKVSGQAGEYSRFGETGAGDLVRSRLPPEGCSLRPIYLRSL